MQAVINISSESTKLRPLVSARAEGLLPIGDITLLERLIKKLSEDGFERVLVLTGKCDEVRSVVGENFGKTKVEYTRADFSDGGLKSKKDLLEEEFLYFSHMVYATVDFAHFFDFHRKKGAYATIVVNPEAGRVVFSEDGRVGRIQEGRLWNSITSEDKGTGVYVLKRDVISFIPQEVTCDLFESVFPTLVRSGKLIYAQPSEKEIISPTDTSSFMRACFLFLEESEESENKIVIREGATVEKGALLEKPCYIGKNAHIHKGAFIGAYSHIGEGCRVKEGARIKRSILLRGCRVGKDVSLRGCVLDEAVTIGDLSSVAEQAVVGKRTHIGEGVSVKSFVRIWPEKTIEDGASVSENVLWGQKKRGRLYKNGIIEGGVNSEITPRFCTMLGECAGAGLSGGEVGISTDGSPSGMMIKEAVTAGLCGMGCRVMDFGEQPVPITRRGVLFYRLAGAVAINVYEREGEDWARISIIGSDGVEADEKTKNRMEDYFEKGDFLYPESKLIRESEYHFEYKIHYLKSLVGYEERERQPYKILVACPTVWGRRLITSAMADFSCSVSMYMPYNVESEKETGAFAQSVDLGGFDMGFIINSQCEKLKIVLRGKRVVDEETYVALTSLIIMKKRPNTKIRVPITAPSAVDMLAKKYGCEVVRGDVLPYEKNSEEKNVSDEYVFGFDAVGALIKITDYLSCESIDALVEEIPKISVAKTFIEIPREEIEDVMGKIKRLGKSAGESDDGVKITLDKGWVVVIKEKGSALCQIVGEGANYETAKELCDFCVEEILKK